VDSTLAVGIAGIVASSATGLGGVWLGSHLSKQTARDLAHDQREWEEERTLRQRKVEAALKTDERLLEAATGMPTVAGPALEAGRAMDQARRLILNAFGRSLVLDDPEINERVRALDMGMLIFTQHAEFLATRTPPVVSAVGEPTINPWPITVAFAEVREALSCFARHVDPPEAKFPRASEVVEMSTDSDGHEVGLDAVMDLLVARRAGPIISG
jgi:hypothetical protein